MLNPQNIKIRSILVYSLVAVIFVQNTPWPWWGYQSFLLPAVLIPVFFHLTSSIIKGEKFSAEQLIVSTLVFSYFFVLHGVGANYRFVMPLITLVILFVCNGNQSLGKEVFELFSLILSWILGVSLFFWLLYIIGIPLPNGDLVYGAWKGIADEGNVIKNYYFFVTDETKLTYRYYSYFDEPGVLGTLSALTICGLRFNFSRRRTWIIAIAGLLTYSLAFIFLIFVGYFLLSLNRNKIKYLYLAVALASLYVFFLLFNVESDDIDSSGFLYILYRIFNYSDHGLSTRTAGHLNDYFLSFIDSWDFIFGMGTDFLSIRNDLNSGQGAIFFIIEYGLIGVIILLTIYLAIINTTGAPKFLGVSLLFIFALSFLQRPVALTPWQIILFWSILCSFRTDKDNKIITLNKSN